MEPQINMSFYDVDNMIMQKWYSIESPHWIWVRCKRNFENSEKDMTVVDTDYMLEVDIENSEKDIVLFEDNHNLKVVHNVNCEIPIAKEYIH